MLLLLLLLKLLLLMGCGDVLLVGDGAQLSLQQIPSQLLLKHLAGNLLLQAGLRRTTADDAGRRRREFHLNIHRLLLLLVMEVVGVLKSRR